MSDHPFASIFPDYLQGRRTRDLIEHHSEIMLALGLLGGRASRNFNPTEIMIGPLEKVVRHATLMLTMLGVEDPLALYIDEFEAAKAKHPGHTFDLPDVPNSSKYWGLAEEAGEVAAALTYDNADSTGHQADLIKEITQVGGLALAWLTCCQDGGER